MSRRAIKMINWPAIAERLPETEKAAFAAFKARADQYMRRMSANPEALPKIDWSYYQKNIITPGIVETFKKQYESMSVPYPADKYSPQLEAEIQKIEAELEAYLKELKELTLKAEKEIERVQQTMRPSEMTMEEFAEHYPKQALTPENPSIWPHDFDVEEDLKQKPEEH